MARRVLIMVFIWMANLSLWSCVQRPTDANLVALLEAHHTRLQSVADRLTNLGQEAIIDLRSDPAIIQPSSLAVDAAPWLDSLRNAQISFAASDSSIGGILFEHVGHGIAVSGISTGLIYRMGEHFGQDVKVVANLDKAFDEARAAQQPNQKLDLMLVHPIHGRWGVYLQTF